jgi:hypothetical protein
MSPTEEDLDVRFKMLEIGMLALMINKEAPHLRGDVIKAVILGTTNEPN